jgi:hypothetical protein
MSQTASTGKQCSAIKAWLSGGKAKLTGAVPSHRAPSRSIVHCPIAEFSSGQAQARQ